MIKVLNKIFDVVEYISAQDGRPVLPAEIKSKLGLAQGTTVRILKALQARGYLDQIGSRQGYVTGYLGWAVFNQKYETRRLIETGQPIISALAEKFGQQAIISTFIKGRRYTVAHRNFNALRPSHKRQFYTVDADNTATGRILLSYASEEDRQDFFALAGEDKKTKELYNSLSEIQSTQRIIMQRKDELDVYLIAVPIMIDDTCIASLGMTIFRPDSVADLAATYLEHCQKAAKEISLQLGSISPGYLPY